MEILLETLIDNLKLFPFLFVTYLLLEYMEHKTSAKMALFLQKARFSGPTAGALCGALPQCGFSVAAANFYAARVIGLGTLLAVFLATSDEMLPILISAGAEPVFLLKIIGYKVLCGICCGYAVGFILKEYTTSRKIDIERLCQNAHCHCEKGIIVPALEHSVRITVFIFLVSLIINLLMHCFDIAILLQYLQIPLLGEMIGGIMGLIPNCSASVILTQLYMENYINISTLLSGTLAGAGVGLLVLFRINCNVRENLLIVALLYVCGIVCGLCGYLLF